MQVFTLVFSLFFATAAIAENLALPADVATVVSVDGKYDAQYSNSVRERFIVRNQSGGEGSQVIILEKYASGRFGAKDNVILVREFLISKLPGIKEYLASVSHKSVEAVYGCCNVDKIERVGSSWMFRAIHDGTSFKCKSVESAKSEITVSCSK